MFDSYFYFKLLHFQKSILNKGFCFVLFANFLGLVVLMKKKKNRDLPGGSVVNTQHFHGRGIGSVPGQDT